MKRIGTKLWLSMMLLVGVMLFLLWLFQIVFLERLYTNTQLDRIAEKAVAWSDELSTFGNLTAIGQDEELENALESFAACTAAGSFGTR